MLGMFAIFRGPENDICAEKGVPKTMDWNWDIAAMGFILAAQIARLFSPRRAVLAIGIGRICMLWAVFVWWWGMKCGFILRAFPVSRQSSARQMWERLGEVGA